MEALKAITNAAGKVATALTPKKKNNAGAKVNAPVIVVPNKKPNAAVAAPVAAPPPAPAPAPQKEASNTSNSTTTLGNSEAQGPKKNNNLGAYHAMLDGGRRRRHTRKHKRRGRKSRRHARRH